MYPVELKMHFILRDLPEQSDTEFRQLLFSFVLIKVSNQRKTSRIGQSVYSANLSPSDYHLLQSLQHSLHEPNNSNYFSDMWNVLKDYMTKMLKTYVVEKSISFIWDKLKFIFNCFLKI